MCSNDTASCFTFVSSKLKFRIKPYMSMLLEGEGLFWSRILIQMNEINQGLPSIYSYSFDSEEIKIQDRDRWSHDF